MTYENFMDKYDIGRVVSSDTWSMGGSYGSCWNDELNHYDADTPKDFEELDDLLIKVCPNLGMLLYKKLSRLPTINESHNRCYYGGSGVTYANHSCDTEDIYNFLVEHDLLDE